MDPVAPSAPLHFQVGPEDAGARLDRFLAERLPEVSRTRIRTWIEEGRAVVDDAAGSAKQKLRDGQQILLRPGEFRTEPEPPKPVPIPLAVVYEDPDLLVINKPPGLVVHAGSGTGRETLVNAVLWYLRGHDKEWREDEIGKWLARSDDPIRPGIVHRLDFGTSGLIVVARTETALAGLQRQFAGRETRKVYRTVVAGVPRRSAGKIDAPIGRHPRHRTRMAVVPDGRDARTEWEVVHSDPGGKRWAALRCRILTGRTHQIRVHLASIGHPVLGDETYGGKMRLDGSLPLRPLLHAAELSIRHPLSGARMDFAAALPDDMVTYFLD